jgi:hypothetical protein
MIVAVGAAALALGAASLPAQAVTSPDTVPASGSFAFTTGNGILPTWSADEIVLIGVSPGSVTTAPNNLNARVRMPIVAKTGSANAAAGGFRLYNSTTLQSLRCSSPTIDTRAHVIDCVLPSGLNAHLFAITSIASRSVVKGSSTVTTIYRKMVLRINGQRMADMLNESLGTTTFSPYVTVGNGDLVVTVDK